MILATLFCVLPSLSVCAKDKCEDTTLTMNILKSGFTTGVFIENGQSVSRTQNWWYVQVDGRDKPDFFYSMPSKWGIYGSGGSYLFTDRSVVDYYKARFIHAVKHRGDRRTNSEWQVCDEYGHKQTFAVSSPLSTNNALKTESFICELDPNEGKCTKLGD